MVAAVLTIPVYAMAGGGGGMDAGGGGGMGGSMGASGVGPMGGQQQGFQSNGQMAKGGSAPSAIMPVMQQTSNIMNQMSKVISPNMSRESRMDMTQTMVEMSTQTKDIAQLMEKGNVSDKEMLVMRQRIAEMQSRLNRMEAK
jgi:hypothetical protein